MPHMPRLGNAEAPGTVDQPSIPQVHTLPSPRYAILTAALIARIHFQTQSARVSAIPQATQQTSGPYVTKPCLVYLHWCAILIAA